MNDEKYTPYGDEWEKEVMKNCKADIAAMLRKACLEREAARLESIILAMLAADEPMFFHPLNAMEAKSIRDRILTPIQASLENDTAQATPTKRP